MRAIAFPDVERAVFLAQVVVRFSVGSPHRRAVFAPEIGEFRVFSLAEQPDVACHGTLMVLAKRVFVAFHVVVEDVAVGIDADVFHRDD